MSDAVDRGINSAYVWEVNQHAPGGSTTIATERGDELPDVMGLPERAKFAMDAAVPAGYIGPFDGWTDGELWNGWATPYFEFTEAARVIEALKSAGWQAGFDDEKDEFWAEVPVEPAEREYYAEMTAITANGERTVYGIGTNDWIWDYWEPDD